MAGPIAAYYASVGLKVDTKSLQEVDRYLGDIEKRLGKGFKQPVFNVKLSTDFEKFRKNIQQGMNAAFRANPLMINNILIRPQKLIKGAQETLNKTQFAVMMTPKVSRAGIQAIRSQIEAALMNMPIRIRVGGVTGARNASGGSAGASGGSGRGTEAARRRASVTGRGDPSFAEFMMGRPDKSSLSAGNRRYVDALMERGLGVFGESTGVLGSLGRAGIGGLGRMASGTILGRGAMMLGTAAGGPVGAVIGAVVSAIPSAMIGVGSAIWSSLGAVITAPFKMLGGAIDMVTGLFFKLATALLPIALVGSVIDRQMTEVKSRQIALNTISKSQGSSGAVEAKWLRNVADRDGMQYASLVDPFTSFIASASPAVGLESAKNIFEAFTQFGVTRGADNESMKRAMVAVSQMAGKGKIGAEELRQQLGDARGFGEMQSIFAEAFQMSQGKNKNNMLTGQKALENLYDEMKKGNVYSAKVLPYVAEVAKRMAEPGLAEARGSSIAERSRFMNQVTAFWQNFSSGGGEQGMIKFWLQMQKFGTWLEANGGEIGGYFESIIDWMNVFRIAVRDLFNFFSMGTESDTTQLLRSWGINISAFKSEFEQIVKNIGDIFGVKGEKSWADAIITKISNFSQGLLGILRGLNEFLSGLAQVIDGYNKWSDMSFGQKMLSLTPVGGMMNTEGSQALGQIRSGVFGMGSGLMNATGGAWDAQTGLLFDKNYTDMQRSGNNGRFYTPPVPKQPIPYKSPSPGVDIGSIVRQQNFMGPPQPAKQDINVNITMQGDTEAIKLLMDERSKQAFTSAIVSAAARQNQN